MERRSNYPIEIKAKIDLNTDLLLTELQQLLGKDRSKLLRLIIADFFNRNIDIIDEHTNSKSDIYCRRTDLGGLSILEFNVLVNGFPIIIEEVL